jgi:coenzyme F420-reducing hydrogenase beta subunit
LAVTDRIGRKRWTPEEIEKYAGSYLNVYFTYTRDESFRAKSASGGSTTALLVHMLESKQIDGALVLKTEVVEGKVTCRFFIARTRAELMSAQGSKYMAVYFTRDALPLIRDFEGRLAVVALPCDSTMLTRLREKDPSIASKVRFIIALVCGHNSEPELTHHVTETLGRGHGKLINYSYRTGHWRGHLTAVYEDGSEIQRPFRYFSDYRNVYLFAQNKCHRCYDHFGYDCDISAGDIWSLYLRRNPIKHTALISRSEAGDQAILAAERDGVLHVEKKDITEVLDGQSRTLPFHYNVTSRARIGRFFGMQINDRVNAPVKWHDYVVAAIAMTNSRVTQSELGRRLAKRIPRPLLRGYVYVFKALELF